MTYEEALEQARQEQANPPVPTAPAAPITAEDLVNENVSPEMAVKLALSKIAPQPGPSRDDILRQQLQAQAMENAMPKTWLDEFGHGVVRSMYGLGESAAGLGALGADVTGWDSARDYFTKAVASQEDRAAQYPTRVGSASAIHDFDTFMRYIFGSAGEAAPQLALGYATGAAGGMLGKLAMGSSEIGEGVMGLLGRNAASDLAETGVSNILDETGQAAAKKVWGNGAIDAAQNELQGYAAKEIPYSQLGDLSKGMLGQQVKQKAQQYGAQGLLAMQVIGQEQGNMYNTLAKNPEVPEENRKGMAIVGGLLGALPMLGIDHYIVGKFFPGVAHPSKAQADEATNWFKNFISLYGADVVKSMPMVSAQGATQALIEQAAQNYANPETRDSIFNYSPEQVQQIKEGALKGAIASLGASAIAAKGEMGAKIPPHPDPAVNKAQADVTAQANQLAPDIPTPQAPPEGLSQMVAYHQSKMRFYNDVINDPNTPDDLKADLIKKYDAHFNTAQALLEKKGFDIPDVSQLAVNNKETFDNATPQEPVQAIRTYDGKQEPVSVTRTVDVAGMPHAVDETGKYIPLEELHLPDDRAPSETLDSSNVDDVWNKWSAARSKASANVSAATTDADKQTATAHLNAIEKRMMDRFGTLDPKTYQDAVKQSVDAGRTWVKDVGLVDTPKAATPEEVAPTKAPEKAKTPIQQAQEHLRAFYGQRMGPDGEPIEQEPIDPVKVDSAKSNLIEHLTQNAEYEGATDAEKQHYIDTHASQFDDNILNFFGQEGIKFRNPTPTERRLKFQGKETYGVWDDANGDINMVIPSLKSIHGTAGKTAVPGESLPDARTRTVEGATFDVPHEIFHVADMVHIRDEWKKAVENGDDRNFNDYERDYMDERGKAFKAAYPNLATWVGRAYMSKDIELTPRALGQEMMRMILESNRKGSLSEVTDQLARLEATAKGQPRTDLKAFFGTWMDAIRNVHDTIAKFFDPNDKSNPEATAKLAKQFNGISEVLDKYGVLVNERRSVEEKVPEPPAEEVPIEKGAVGERAPPEKKIPLAPVEEEKTMSVQEALDRNAHVKYEGQKGRLAVDEDGALVFRTPKQDFLLQDKAQPDVSLKDMGIDVLRASERKSQIIEAQQEIAEAHPNDAEAVLKGEDVPEGPKEYHETLNDPLVEHLSPLFKLSQDATEAKLRTIKKDPELREIVDSVTHDQLNRAENKIFNALDAIDKMKASDERKQELSQPLEELQRGLQFVREQKINEEARAEEERAAAEREQAEAVREAAPVEAAPVREGEKPTEPVEEAPQKRERIGRLEQVRKNLVNEIEKARETGHVDDAMVAHIRYMERKTGTKVEDWTKSQVDQYAREFKELYGKGATLKLYKEVAGITEEKAAKEAAMKAVPTTEQEEIAEKIGLKYNGPFMDRLDMYTDQIPGSPSEGTTFSVPFGASHEEVMRRLEAKQNEFAAMEAKMAGAEKPFHFGEKPAAMAALPPQDKEQKLNLRRAGAMAMESARKKMEGIIPKDIGERKISERGPKGRLATEAAGVPQEQIFKIERNMMGTMLKAHDFIDEYGDHVKMARELLADPTGKFLGIVEDGSETGIPGVSSVNATLKAIYEECIQHLPEIAREIYKTDRETAGALIDMQRQLHMNSAQVGGEAGAYNKYTGTIEKVYTWQQAKEEYVTPLFEGLSKVIGKKVGEKLADLTSQIGEAMAEKAGPAAQQAKVAGLLMQLHEMVQDARFSKGVRKSIIENIETLRDICDKGASRMAQHVALEKDGQVWANRAIQRMVKEMTGVPKGVDVPTEQELFHNVLNETIKAAGKEEGLIPESLKGEKVSNLDKMAATLKNEELYRRFVDNLRDAYVSKYGPSPQIVDEANAMHQRLMQRLWSDDMVNRLVNEKKEEYKIKMSEIVDKGKAKFMSTDLSEATNFLHSEITEYLKSQGVENEGLVNQLADDIKDSFTKQVQDAMVKFKTTKGGIVDFLNRHQMNLEDIARSSSKYGEALGLDMKQMLLDDHYPPELAEGLSKAMTEKMAELTTARREKIMENWKNKVERERQKELAEAGKTETERVMDEFTKDRWDKSTKKILEAFSVGALNREDVYNAIAKDYRLPEYSPLVVQRIKEVCDLMQRSQWDGQRDLLSQDMARILAENTPRNTKEGHMAYAYFAMLSGGLSPQIGNTMGNLGGWLGWSFINMLKYPSQTPEMFRAMFQAATGKAAILARESLMTGYELGRQGEKFGSRAPIAELTDPYFKSSLGDGTRTTLQKADENLAGFGAKIMKYLGGKYVSRMFAASDMYFRVLTEEMAYSIRQGFDPITQPMFDTAMGHARDAMALQGQDPGDSQAMARRQKYLAYTILEEQRLKNADGTLNEDKVASWVESGKEALKPIYSQEPTGVLGNLCRHLEKWGQDHPVAKLMILPFARTACNVVNEMVAWTPIGAANFTFRELVKEGGNPMKMLMEGFKEGKWTDGSEAALKSIVGTAGAIALYTLLGKHVDDEDPFFMVYGDGPSDPTRRKEMEAMGWKPNTLKIGGVFVSYRYAPISMMLSIIGKQFDNYREGKYPTSGVAASAAVALAQSIKNESFLQNLSDLLSTVDGPNPEHKMVGLMARWATLPVPGILKLPQRIFDPTAYQAESFWQAVVRETPMAALTLKPALNVFGQPVTRFAGFGKMFSLDRVLTMEKTDDPVLNLLSEKKLYVPGFAKGTRIGDWAIDNKTYYDLVQRAGPRIYDKLMAESATIHAMYKDDAQRRIDEICTEEKNKVKDQIRMEMGIPKKH